MYSNSYQWKRIRKRVLEHGESLRCVAKTERISRSTLRKMLAYDSPPGYRGRKRAAGTKDRATPARTQPCGSRSAVDKLRWMEWIYLMEQGTATLETSSPAIGALVSHLSVRANDPRKKVLTVLAHQEGFSASAIAEHLAITRKTVSAYLTAFERGGESLLLGRRQKVRKADDESFKRCLFELLHEPPSLSGLNRTTWRMVDLKKVLKDRGHPVSDDVIRQAIKNAGFRWKVSALLTPPLTMTEAMR